MESHPASHGTPSLVWWVTEEDTPACFQALYAVFVAAASHWKYCRIP